MKHLNLPVNTREKIRIKHPDSKLIQFICDKFKEGYGPSAINVIIGKDLNLFVSTSVINRVLNQNSLHRTKEESMTALSNRNVRNMKDRNK